MHILLTGASGFIGRHLAQALSAAGHHVRRAVSTRSAARLPDAIGTDFARDTSPAIWCERLSGIDTVINAVGVLRDTRARPIDTVHRETPIALFDACMQMNVRRIIQISALGIEDNPTRYASSKCAADAHLLALMDSSPCTATILRPSVVFGYGGASSGLFMNLARLPLLCLPAPVLSAKVQPVAVSDLAAAVTALVDMPTPLPGILPITGPEPVPLAALIASLRQQLGQRPATVLRLPDLMTRLSARLGDWIPASPWCSETLALLAKDNIGDAALLRGLLGRDAVHYRHLVETVWTQGQRT